MNTTIDLTAFPLWLAAVIALVLFLAAVGAFFIGSRIYAGFRPPRWMREDHAPAEPAADLPMLVVAPWSEAGTSDVLTGAVVWRREVEAAPVPVFDSTPLPDHDSVWRFKPFNLDDPQRTGAWPIVRGVDAQDLDMEEEPPKQLPGFEVEESARKRFQISSEVLREVAENLPKKRKTRAKVDLDAGTVVVSS